MGTGYLLNYDLERQTAEREGWREREREKQRVRASVLQKEKSHGNTKATEFFLFYLSELRAGLLGSDLPNSLIQERRALILKRS